MVSAWDLERHGYANSRSITEIIVDQDLKHSLYQMKESSKLVRKCCDCASFGAILLDAELSWAYFCSIRHCKDFENDTCLLGAGRKYPMRAAVREMKYSSFEYYCIYSKITPSVRRGHWKHRWRRLRPPLVRICCKMAELLHIIEISAGQRQATETL